ncbi:MAG: hypothetical protein LUF01_14520 [Bacteroides sp.]|nr:hypothetical protein [Bacteroides sp.]
MSKHQQDIADFLRGEVVNPSRKFNWTNQLPQSSIAKWALGNEPIDYTNLTLVCYEVPIFAALVNDYITIEKVKELYLSHIRDGVKWHILLTGKTIMPLKKYDWQNDTKEIPIGSIISFNGDEHIAVALGKNEYGKNLMVGLWGFDINGYLADTPLTIDHVEAIATFISERTGGAVEVQYANSIF